MVKLLSIKPSTNKYKKLMATFLLSDKSTRIIHFGDPYYEDYTIHKDDKRKELYLNRHKSREDWKDPLTKGALSRWVLWNKPSLSASIKDFKNKFNL